jgi:hypothetical protein
MEDNTLVLTMPGDSPVGYPNFSRSRACAPGDLVHLEAEARATDVSGGFGVYLSVAFMDANGQRLSFNQSGPAHGTHWQRLSVTGIAPPETARVFYRLLLNGHGTAAFRAMEATLEPAPPKADLSTPVTLSVSPTPVCDHLVGIGFEDDGWAYDRVNNKHGVDEQDLTHREDRIRAMDPDWVRMFFWYRDWNPSGDGETFTWDSDGMESHYRTLALYQDMGAVVNVTGVEWGIREPFADPEALARAWTALLDHLIRVKGFTCVQQWTLTNEPNTSYVPDGGTFEGYLELYETIVQSFEEAGLDVAIVGSDDTNGGWPWFRACVTTPAYDNLVDLYASHRYFKYQDRALATDFFDRRLDLLNGRKPFVLAEFGFHDARTEGPLINPVMEDFDYALWTADFALKGLNKGVAGFSIWCAHEVFYPFDAKMNYGLWNFRDRDWSLRPVYYFWRLLTQQTEAGDKVYPVSHTHEEAFRAVRVGDDFFFANLSDKNLRLNWNGPRAEGGRVHTEANLEAGMETDLNSLPPRSFGHATWPRH